MSTSSAVLQLHHREGFERNVTRALAAGVAAGTLAYLARRLQVPVEFLALVGTGLACVRGDKLDRLMLAAIAVGVPTVAWFLGLSPAWTLGLAGAAVGVVTVKAAQCEQGEEHAVGAARLGPLHYLAAALATAGLAVAGSEVAARVAGLLAAFSTPPLLRAIASGATIALFAGIGGLAAHLMLKSDPVEARVEELIPTLQGDFRAQLERALGLYRACGASLAALPREPAREELARTLQAVTREAAELASDWAGVEAQLAGDTEGELSRQVSELSRQAAAARDPIAKRQLEQAAASLKEEIDRLGELKLKRERVLARITSQVAMLERARLALVGMRSGQATVRAAEMNALARKFSALASAQATEARLAHEVATTAELSAQEAELHAAVQVAENVARSAPPVVQALLTPVTEVRPDDDGLPPLPGEKLRN